MDHMRISGNEPSSVILSQTMRIQIIHIFGLSGRTLADVRKTLFSFHI